jgi:hypothetical protein
MKVTAGAHPDFPMPFSNGPEDPPPPIRGRAEPLRLATERHGQGTEQLAALLNHWLGRSGMSHDQLVAIAAWGLGEQGIFDSTAISRIRNSRQVRGANWRHLDALAAANEAIYLWQTGGERKAWAKLGPHSGWGIRDQWLDDGYWLPHPDHPDRPLRFADMAEVLAGYLDLPYLNAASLSPAEARRMSDGLSALLEELIVERGWGPKRGSEELIEAYPVEDKARQRRLKALIVGDTTLSREELEAELHAIAEMIRVVRGLRPGSYGPDQLRAELLSAPPPRS